MFKLSNKSVPCLAVAMLILAFGGGSLLAGAAAPPAPAGQTCFDLPGAAPEVLGCFKACRRAVVAKARQVGFIDWSGKRLVAVGRSVQTQRGAAGALKARRGATVIALRNLLALSVGVRIGINGRIQGLKSGELFLKGYLKDFKISRTYSRVEKGRTYWFAEVRVPLFGVRHIAGNLYEEQLMVHRQLVGGRRRARWARPARPADIGGDVLVIDARGVGFTPCMYPLVVNEAGHILFDMETVPRDVAIGRGPCAYAETDLKFEKLQSRRGVPAAKELAAGAMLPWQNVDGVGWDALLLAEAPPPTRPASRPATRPRRAPRRHAVKAIRAKGKQKAVLVISNREALKLLGDSGAAGLARNGRVLVVVDAAGAGMEGRLPPAAPAADAAVDIAARAR
jgi:hypothetical protein